MSINSDIKEILEKEGIVVKDIVKKEIKRFGDGAHIIVRKRYMGKRALVIILQEE